MISAECCCMKDSFGFWLCDAGSGMFDASQYAFFGKDIKDEVELGGLEDEEVDLPAIRGGFGGDEELNEYHLFDKDEVNI